ncbi:MAG: TipAS antibiotic-recognition domain-containing protein [Clostridia bacterium]|nr:TipAS antibiotic-recognition domain-containing protein [Clostridia bacterium]MBR3819189.1 TipAS antibiotic-recognition domain-containing protein [Clostridia bacterium]
MTTSDNNRNEVAQFPGKKLKSYTSDDFYTCTPEIFAGFGHMYVDDDCFESNVDNRGIRTAKFILDAYEIYCK